MSPPLLTGMPAARIQPPADQTFKALGFLVTRAKAEGAATETEAATPVFRLSSEVLDRHRDRVNATSVKTENFNKNPVLLWNHHDWEPAIGTAKVYQDGNEWFMEPTFDGIGERSQEVAAKVKAGTLRSCSMRFRFLKYSFNEDGGLDYEEVELLECSITNVPGNQEALRVKSQSQTPTQQNNPTPADTAAKALEQGDADALSAIVQEALKPVLEELAAIKALCQSAGHQEADTTEEKSAEESEAERKDQEGEGIEVELSEEEAQEMKAFFGPGHMPGARR